MNSDNEWRAGNTERAIIIMDKAIAQNPFFAESYLKRATLLSRIGRFSEARQDRLTAFKINPYLSEFLSSQKLKRLQYIAFDPDQITQSSDSLYVKPLGGKLQSSLQKKLNGEINEALIELSQVFADVNQPDASLYNMKGSLHLLLSDYHNAVIDYTQAIQLEPQSAEYYFNRGVAQLFTYDRPAACADLQQSKELGYEPSEKKLQNFCFN